MKPAFSARTEWDLKETALSQLFAEQKRVAGTIDLTVSNPTRVGLMEPGRITELLREVDTRAYSPEALGSARAREAISGWLRSQSRTVDPDRLFLSASTSEAYSWLWKLLCNPDDEILVPSPSYPLFDYLARLESVRTRPYRLLRDERFRIDVGEIERSIGPLTRAIVVVSPNNPTGTRIHRDDARALESIASENGIALVSDEVFAEYLWEEAAASSLPTFARETSALTFVMGGLSKSACSPQLKLAFTSVHGEEAEVRTALERLELIGDTYLSVGTPIQLAVPEILRSIGQVQGELLGRIRTNLATLDHAVAGVSASGTRRLAGEGGWTAVLEVPRIHDEADWIRLLALEAKVLVQPGFYFEFDRDGFLVLSLIGPEEEFRVGVERLANFVAEQALDGSSNQR